MVRGIATATEVSTVGVVYTRAAGAAGLPPVRLAADLSAAGGDGGADRRGDADRRHRHGDGLGADPVRVLQLAGGRHGGRAGRPRRLPGDHHRDLHHPGQRAGGDSGDPAVRPAAAAGGPGDGRARGALFDHRDPGDGDRVVRAAAGGWVLRRLRDRQDLAGRRAVADLAVYFRAGGGAGDRCRGAVAVGRVPVRACRGKNRLVISQRALRSGETREQNAGLFRVAGDDFHGPGDMPPSCWWLTS